MNISMQEIKYFITAAECLNFTQAAQRLYTSQPVISKWIGKLENELGAKLFSRGQYGVELTPTGELLYRSWSVIMRDFELSLETAGIKLQTSARFLRLGVLDMLKYEAGVMDTVNSFEAADTGISVMLEFYNFKELRDRFTAGELDAIYSFSSALQDLEGVTPLFFGPIDMYVATTDARAESDMGVLNGAPLLLVSPAESRHGGESAVAVCEKLGIKPGELSFMPNSPSLEVALRNGKGFTIGGSYLKRGSGDSVVLIPVPHELDGTRLMLAYKRGRLSRELRSYVELAEKRQNENN